MKKLDDEHFSFGNVIVCRVDQYKYIVAEKFGYTQAYETSNSSSMVFIVFRLLSCQTGYDIYLTDKGRLHVLYEEKVKVL